MEDSFGGMFKLSGSNYSVWKSDKDLWLQVQFGKSKPDKIDASTCEEMHMRAATYLRCFIDMSLYNNFREEADADFFCKKIGIMFENKNTMNRVPVFKKIVRI